MANNKIFTVGQLVSFQLPAAWGGMMKYEGYISSLPEDNDPYNRYTIRSFDGIWTEKQVGEKLIHATQIFGCATYHELLAAI